MKKEMIKSPVAVLARPKLNGLGEHWGIGIPNGLVAHHTSEHGQRICSYEEFARGRAVRIVRYVPHEELSRTLNRISLELATPSPYDLLTNNCETFVTKVMGEPPQSQQVNGWLTALVLGSMLYLAAT